MICDVSERLGSVRLVANHDL